MSRSKNLKQKQIQENNRAFNNAHFMDANSIFTLFSKETHQVNWYVHRDITVRKSLKDLWSDKSDGKKDLSTMTVQQLAVTKANVLFRQLEKDGPKPQTTAFKIKLDSKHGAREVGKENCASKGYYHTHVTDSITTYVVIWECFEKQRLINILAVAKHENFDYSQRGHDPIKGMADALAASRIANFNPEGFDMSTYNNAIYPK